MSLFAAPAADYTVFVNGNKAENLEVAYGESLNFELRTADRADAEVVEGAKFYYAADAEPGTETDVDWTQFINGAPCLLETGKRYYLNYVATVAHDGADSTIWDFDDDNIYRGSFSITVTKGALDAPRNLSWDGTRMSWDGVSTASGGYGDGVSGAVAGYQVTLYRDGAEVRGIQNIADTSYDLTSAAFLGGEEPLGSGSYTFRVKAVADPESGCYTDSTMSGSSAAFTVPLVTAAGDSGVEAVTPGETFLLLPGVEGYDWKEISASVKTEAGYRFLAWTVTDAGYVVFGNASAGSTTVTLEGGYDGPVSLTIRAVTGEETAPEILSFTAGGGQLAGTARDNDGIAGYVFTTEGDASAAGGWMTAKTPAGEEETFTFTPESGGVYYFHVKDRSGNTATAGETENVTAVSLRNYDNGGTAVTRYIVGSVSAENPYLLPVPACAGYNFTGWFDSEGSEVTEITAHDVENGYVLTARWAAQDIGTLSIPAYEGVYDGTEHTLSAEVSGVTGTLEYQWWKQNNSGDYEKIGNQTGRLTVKNVADSGNYRVDITLKDAQGNVIAQRDAAHGNPVDTAASIRPKPLTIRAKDCAVSYGAPVPEYELIYESFAEGEDESVLTGARTVSCAYVQGAPKGVYDITLSDFQAENYTITLENGWLTVNQKSDLNVSLKDGVTEYTYTGAAIEPDVVVKDGETVLAAGTDYTVSYSDQVEVGEATVTVTYTGANYTGGATLHFTITKAEFPGAQVAIDSWKYDGQAHGASLSGAAYGGTVTYYYGAGGAAKGDSGAWSTACPVNAGTYQVYASVTGMANYEDFETAAEEFTIEKRTVILKAADASFIYDGYAHVCPEYEFLSQAEGNDGFAQGEGFSFVKTSGSITDVADSPQNNTIAGYGLSASTLSGNYEIVTGAPQCVGQLTVVPLELTVPSGAGWSDTEPGTAAWVAVTKSGLTVKYELELYAVDSEGQRSLVAGPVETTGTACDFADAIRAYAKDNGVYSYGFTIRTVPQGGDNFQNYQACAFSEDLKGSLHTAVVSVAKHPDNPDMGALQEPTIGGVTDSVTMLEGESAQLSVTANPGYYFEDLIWLPVPDDAGLTVSGVKTQEDTKTSTATLTARLTRSLAGVTVYAKVANESPEIESFRGSNGEGYAAVTLSFTARDSKDLEAWALSGDGENPPAAEDASLWTAFETDGKAGTASAQVTEAGTYYLYVKDGAGNVVRSSQSQSVYSIAFRGGAGAAENQGGLPSMLKAQNTTVTLPSVGGAPGYTNEGHDFLHWSGSTGIYPDGAGYSANNSDVLTAVWTGQMFEYTVNDYRMDLEGSYELDGSGTFTAVYGAEIAAGDVGEVPQGFSLEEERSPAITITGEGQALNVYYSRNQYTLTYSYQDVHGEIRSLPAETYYYGAALNVRAVPEEPGYDFVGWTFDKTGTAPAAMPAEDITASGYFRAKETGYHIRYFLQDLNGAGTGAGDTYTMLEELNQDFSVKQGDPIRVSADMLETIKGYTFAGAGVTKGAEGTAAFPSDPKTMVSETAEAGTQLYVNCYFNRNPYNIILNVWQGEVDTGELKYRHVWPYVYGARVDHTVDYAGYRDEGESEWPHDGGYVLADYVNWSHGGTDAPAAMPAGDVTVTRQFVSETIANYQVQVYLQGADGAYGAPMTFTYSNNIGRAVTLGGSDSDTVNYNNFRNSIDNFDAYHVDGDRENILSGAVADPAKGDPLTLKIYFARDVVTATIRYYYNDGSMTAKQLMATVTKSGLWGSTYDCEALALFDPVEGGSWREAVSGYTQETEVEGTAPDRYDFRNHNYVVSYAGYYRLEDTGAWPSFDYDSVDSLETEGHTSKFGCIGESYVNVTYTRTDTTKQYYLNAGYNAGNLAHGANEFVPLTAAYDGAEYKIRIANEAFFYPDARYVPDDSEAYQTYPGLAYYNLNAGNAAAGSGRFLYDTSGTPRTGFEKVQIGGKTYYLNRDEGYLYIADPANRFFAGNFTSYGYSESEIGYSDVTDYLARYKAEYAGDPYAQGAYVYSRSWGSTIVYYGEAQGTYNLTITMRNGNTYRLRYEMGGTACLNDAHVYAAGSVIQPEEVGCGHGTFPAQEGYEIVWYTDSGCTDRVDAPITMDGNKTVYGKYEKKALTYTTYAYFELADPAELGGVTYSYITEADLDRPAVAEAVEKLGPVPGEDGTATVTFRYGGEAVMVKKVIPAETFIQVEMDLGDAAYSLDGLHYDESNSKNLVKGYCQTEPITLRAYFARNVYPLTVDMNWPAALELPGSVETAQYRNGQRVTLADPELDGYAFTGWTWSKGGTAWTGYAPDPAGAEFVMPEAAVKAVATWDAASFRQTITHYFQNVDGLYDTVSLAAMEAESGTPVSLRYGAEAYEGMRYSNGGVSLEKDGKTWYFTAAPERDGAYWADNGALAAVVQTCGVTQDVSYPVEPVSVSGYGFAYGSLIYKGTKTPLGASDSYTARAGMQMEYYYARGTFAVTLSAFTSAGEPLTALTLTGAGTYPSGKTVKLAADVPKGYTFAGWYLAEDVLDNGALKADWSGADRQAATAAASVQVTADAHYAAVLCPTGVDEPWLNVSGREQLVFGYGDDPGNAVTVSAEFAQGSSSYVKSYQWYRNGELISGATDATYLIPTGWDAGTYQLVCQVTAARRDNGLEQVFQTPVHTLAVDQKPIAVSVKNYEGVYDKEEHTFQIAVEDPAAEGTYEIYYAETELTAENYRAGSAVKPGYQDVNVDEDGGRIPHTVYYYVRALDPNYADVSGSAQVNITAQPVTLRAGKAVYSKTYDGSDIVRGTVQDLDSDLGKLVRQRDTVYIIKGLLPGDEGVYIIDAAAQFNDGHVSGANAITLSRLKLCFEASTEINYNYAFAPSYTIQLSGYITPLELTVDWTCDAHDEENGLCTLIYDGTARAPEAEIKDKDTLVPEGDRDNLTLSVSGKQTYVGTGYDAVAKLAVGGSSRASDFVAAGSAIQYQIVKRPITVVPVGETEVVYDGREHGLTVDSGNGSITSGTLAPNHTLTAGTSGTGTDAGGYSITADHVVIRDAGGTDVTENYAVTTPEAALTIRQRPVQASATGTYVKAYDGTTGVGPDIVDYVGFDEAEAGGQSGVLEDDEVALASYGAEYDHAAVSGNDPVHMTGMTLTNANYTLVSDQLDIPGAITGAVITAAAKEKTVVYGTADPGFEVVFTLQGADTLEDVLDVGTVGYQICQDGGEPADYSGATPVGTYRIKLDLTNVAVRSGNGNYLSVVQDPDMTHQTLTVTPRPVALGRTEYDGASPIAKEYDGTSTVTASGEEISRHYQFTAVSGKDESGVTEGDADGLGLSFRALYDSQNAADSRTVTLSGLSLTGAKSGNYTLETESIGLNGKITPKPLTVTAEDQTVTYGEAAPQYTVKYSGFVPGDTPENSVDASALAFTCAYRDTDPDNRGVRAGGYPIAIQAGSLTSGNYALTLAPGTLTVDPAQLTVTTRFGASKTESASITYGDGIPALSYGVTGFRYGEDESVITVNSPVTYTCGNAGIGEGDPTVPGFPKGTYAIQPVADGLWADNYVFVTAPGYLTVEKRTENKLTVSGIQIKERVYDGTTEVYGDQYDLSAITIDGLQQADWDLVEEDPAAYLTVSGGVYDGKDAGSGHRVSGLTVTLGSYLAARYVMDETASQQEAEGDIARRPLTVTAVNPAPDKQVPYGSAAPEYRYETDGLVGGETISGVTYDCGYSESPYSPVGSYSLAIGQVVWGTAQADNYDLRKFSDTLEVTRNQLAAPSPVWSGDDPGQVSWAAVPGIGDVAVEKYQVQLYKDGVLVEDSGAAATGLTYDYTAVMRGLGAGAYTVRVTAIASEEHNADHKNVADSAPGMSAARHAALVRFAFREGAPGGTENITIGGVAGGTGVVMFPGDTAELGAELANTTGYVVSSVTSSNPAVTVADPSDDMDGGTRNTYASAASMAGDPGSAGPITITLTPAARTATLEVTLVKSKNEDTRYGYTERPVVTATAVPLEGDTISQDQYTYTFSWKIYEGLEHVLWEDAAENNVSVYQAPTGYSANDNERYYKVQCTVTAVRGDNGQTVTSKTQTVYLQIGRATFDVEAAQEGWEYGEARKTPVLTYSSEEAVPEAAEVTLWYVSASAYDAQPETAPWTTAAPQNVGDYYVKAAVAQRTNYEGRESAPAGFSITRATLERPVITGMGATAGKASYGQLNWTWDNVVYENGGNPDNFAAAASYEVKLYRDGGVIRTYTTAEKTLNILEDIQTPGSYQVTVAAISSNPVNCGDSAESVAYAIHVGEAVGSGTSKVYDGVPVTLTASGSGSFQWYKDGEAVSGATGSTYAPKHVADSGFYHCVVTGGGQTTYTPWVQVTITRRPVTLTSATDSRPYNGAPLTNSHVEVGGDKFVDGEGADYTVTGTQTAAGSSGNTFTYTLKTGTQAGDYDITTVYGTLTVTAQRMDSSGITVADIPSVTYTGLAHRPQPAVTDGGTPLVEGTDFVYASYTNNVDAGTASVTITGRGNYAETITKTFRITPAALTVTTPSRDKEYDGMPLTAAGSLEGLVNGETAGFRTTGTQTLAGSSENSYELVFQAPDNGYTAKAGNYTVSEDLGTLEVRDRAEKYEITVVSNSRTETYDGTERTIGGFETLNFTVGGVAYTVEGLTAEGRGTDAGSYANTITGTAAVKDSGGHDVTEQFTVHQREGALTIGKAALTVTTPSDSKVYDGTALTAAGSLEGLVNGETAGFATTGAQTGVGHSGNTYQLVFRAPDNHYTAKAGNYEISKALGTLTVTESTDEITVTTTGGAFPYDGKAHGAAVEVTGVPRGYTVAQAASSASATHVAEGTVTATADRLVIRNAAGEDVTGKLNIKYVDGSITITPAPLTVTTPDAGKVYDGTPLTAVGTVAGLADRETVTIIAAGSQLNRGESRNTYELTWDGTAKESDYEITGVKLGTLTVTARSLGSGAAYAEGISVADIPDVDYRHEAYCPEPAVTDDGLASGTGAVLEKGRDFTYSHYENNLSAGTASVTITGTGNYTGSITKTFTINHLTLTQSDVDGGDASLIVVTSPEEGRRVSAEVRNELEIINACLTDGEKWRVRNTPDRVQLRLTISRMEAGEVVPDEKELVERYLDSNQGTVLGTYLDIRLDRSWDGWQTWENIPETAVDVRIVFDIPQELQAFNRTFTVYRVHQTQDGGGRYHEALLNDLDSGGDTFTMDTRYFSTYALLYRQSEAGGAGGGGAAGGAPGGIAGETEKSGPASPWDTGVADYLNCLDHVSYISGDPEGTAGPCRNATRAEVAMMFYRLLKDPAPGKGTRFPDVEEGAWYAEAVETLSALGIVAGYPDGRFGPNDFITRAEFTTMAVRFSRMEEGSSNFPDVPATHWARRFVDVSASYGWVVGLADGTFRPDAKITRGEVATIINRMLGRRADADYVEQNFRALKQFPDLQDHAAWYFYDMVEASNRHDYTVEEGSERWK